MSAYLFFGDSCLAGDGTRATLIPEVGVDGVAVVLLSWNRSCSDSLNTVVISVGLLGVAGSLWMMSEVILTWWRILLETE